MYKHIQILNINNSKYLYPTLLKQFPPSQLRSDRLMRVFLRLHLGWGARRLTLNSQM